MKEPAFDIFSGGPEKDPMWLETVAGLSNARDRMQQLAAKKPGPYFLFSVLSQAVVARVEAVPNSESKSKARGNSA